jgi:hypothetical protein
MRYKITSKGIEKSEDGEFATWAEVMAEWNRRISTTTKPQTIEQKRNTWMAEHNVPTNPPTRRNSWNDQPPEDS